MLKNTEKKIDQNGHLLPNYSPEKSKFYEILESDDARLVEDWLIKNGYMKTFCPFRFIDKSLEKNV